jgi:site-specific DNA-methyltransferase (adenine-specific)
LDPFTGSGTTGIVALSNFRRFLGIELNPAYAAMATRRIAAAVPGPALFNQQEQATA